MPACWAVGNLSASTRFRSASSLAASVENMLSGPCDSPGTLLHPQAGNSQCDAEDRGPGEPAAPGMVATTHHGDSPGIGGYCPGRCRLTQSAADCTLFDGAWLRMSVPVAEDGLPLPKDCTCAAVGVT